MTGHRLATGDVEHATGVLVTAVVLVEDLEKMSLRLDDVAVWRAGRVPVGVSVDFEPVEQVGVVGESGSDVS